MQAMSERGSARLDQGVSLTPSLFRQCHVSVPLFLSTIDSTLFSQNFNVAIVGHRLVR